MAKTIFNVLEGIYPDVINSLPSELDSHDFIRKLAHKYQKLYVSALSEYLHKNSLFMIVHGEIARRLGNFSHLINKSGTRDSADIFQQKNSAVIWNKIK